MGKYYNFPALTKDYQKIDGQDQQTLAWSHVPMVSLRASILLWPSWVPWAVPEEAA